MQDTSLYIPLLIVDGAINTYWCLLYFYICRSYIFSYIYFLGIMDETQEKEPSMQNSSAQKYSRSRFFFNKGRRFVTKRC